MFISSERTRGERNEIKNAVFIAIAFFFVSKDSISIFNPVSVAIDYNLAVIFRRHQFNIKTHKRAGCYERVFHRKLELVALAYYINITTPHHRVLITFTPFLRH